jgi:hypothetical protein
MPDTANFIIAISDPLQDAAACDALARQLRNFLQERGTTQIRFPNSNSDPASKAADPIVGGALLLTVAVPLIRDTLKYAAEWVKARNLQTLKLEVRDAAGNSIAAELPSRYASPGADPALEHLVRQLEHISRHNSDR